GSGRTAAPVPISRARPRLSAVMHPVPWASIAPPRVCWGPLRMTCSQSRKPMLAQVLIFLGLWRPASLRGADSMCAHRIDGMAATERADVAAWRAMLYANDRLLKRLAEEMLREHDLELSWYEMLMHLAEAGGPINQRDLHQRTLMGQSGLSRVLAKMSEDGLVRRVTLAEDRRNLSVELTDRGRERLRRAAPLHLQGIKQWFGDQLTASQTEAIRVGLQRVLRTLAGEPGAEPKAVEPVAIG